MRRQVLVLATVVSALVSCGKGEQQPVQAAAWVLPEPGAP